MDASHQNHQAHIGRPAADLPTPAVVLSRPVLEKNIGRLHEDVDRLGIAFRPHVKTLKSLEVTRMMLGARHRKVVASTLAEIAGCLPLVDEGLLDEALYGLPLRPSALGRLAALSQSIAVSLMVDHEQHVDQLEQFAVSSAASRPAKWPVFVKIDVGTQRAGVAAASAALASLVQRIEASPAADLLGFYCHAGHSYACRTPGQAVQVLQAEIDTLVAVAQQLPRCRPLVLSIGSTPTAHVVRELKAALPDNVTLELHAGNFPSNDLQQVSTGLVDESQQALRLVAEVCSVYPERNEALINAGTIALSKETSVFPGYGRLLDPPGWAVVRMSQEHGILGAVGTAADQRPAQDVFRVGQKVFLHVQHACITAAAHSVYYVVDAQDVVRQTWVPWKGW